MDGDRRSAIGRYSSSALLAIPITIALFYIMTRLILPSENDRVVSQMIETIELVRATRQAELAPSLPTEPRRVIDQEPAEPEVIVRDPLSPQVDIERPAGVQREDSNPEADRPTAKDWWAAVREFRHNSDKDTSERWFLDNGYSRYTTIMQGDTPTQGRAVSEPTEGPRYGMPYMNIYGLTEIQFGDNCFATSQFEGRFGNGELAKYLPMNIKCKKNPKQKFSFERE